MYVKIELRDDNGDVVETWREPWPISFVRFALLKDELNRKASAVDPTLGRKGVRYGEGT